MPTYTFDLLLDKTAKICTEEVSAVTSQPERGEPSDMQSYCFILKIHAQVRIHVYRNWT